MKDIHIWGARQNNLKGVEVRIPLGSLTVICGPSGSGKSSLAFETLYAEGQRRYIESLSNYSKQFLNKAPKPDIEGIENIPPALAIEQKNSVKSSRSTVGTTTEVIDYLRLIYEKLGRAYCPHHQVELLKDSPSSAADRVLKNFTGLRGYVLSPVFEKDRVLNGKELLDYCKQQGYLRIYKPRRSRSQDLDWKAGQEFSRLSLGEVVELSQLKPGKGGLPKSDFYLVMDRMAFSQEDRPRLVDSLDQAFSASLKLNRSLNSAQAVVIALDPSKAEQGQRLLLGEDPSCSVCNHQLPPITSALLSFNSPVGACPSCKGFGNLLKIDEAKVVPNPQRSLNQGTLEPFAMPSAAADRKALRAYCKKAKIDMDTPWEDLKPAQRKKIWEGDKDFYGVLGLFEYLETKKYKMHVRVFLSRYKSPFTCEDCQGTRLRPEARQVLLGSRPITEVSAMTLEDLLDWAQGLTESLSMTPEQRTICAEPLRQLLSRLEFLCHVGVGYLTLDRPTRTLSGGEYQRLSLANQLGMGLSQTLYVLDEPTVGLHPRDNDRLIALLKKLRDLGNTLVVVEHDQDVIKNSSHVIEMGPGSGHLGGELIYSGLSEDFYQCEESNTAPYIRPERPWEPPREPRPVDWPSYRYKLKLTGCRGHNLKNVNLELPLHRLVTLTGVSGSGKSTLIGQTLYPALARHLDLDYLPQQPFDHLDGAEHLKNLVFIDQGPIGKTARSNPVTYLKVFDAIRNVMASGHEARSRGYGPGTFSLNVEGGRCPACKGLGFEMIDMMFMDDIKVICEACDGLRYRSEILEITYKGKNIAEVLDMTATEAMDFFVSYPNIRKPLSVLKEVGLGYLRLGQSANSLSGGESQRLKVARELSQAQQKATLYIMDEPTTGLHFKEVHLLLKVLHKLIEGGASVILIEHNLEVIKNSDYVIDLGPEAGQGGGRILAQGTPAELMKSRKGYTGKYLKDYCRQGAGQ